MKFTPEQLAEWKALVTKLIDDSSDHMGVAHSTDMPPQHTVNFRHAKNAHEAAWAITNLIADLEEAQKDLENERARGIHSCHDNCTQDGCVNRRLRDELAATRKQLAEALAKIAAVRKLCAGDRAPNWTNDASVYSTRGYILDLTECEMSALQSAIAEAVEPYRKDAERWKELLSLLGDDSGPTIVKIEGWSDEYPGYAWFADLTQEQVIAELDTAIAAKGESK